MEPCTASQQHLAHCLCSQPGPTLLLLAHPAFGMGEVENVLRARRSSTSVTVSQSITSSAVPFTEQGRAGSKNQTKLQGWIQTLAMNIQSCRHVSNLFCHMHFLACASFGSFVRNKMANHSGCVAFSHFPRILCIYHRSGKCKCITNGTIYVEQSLFYKSCLVAELDHIQVDQGSFQLTH